MTRTPEEIAELNRMIEVMQAFRDGASIEGRSRDRSAECDWESARAPVWDWDLYDYRIALTKDVYPWHLFTDDVVACARDKDGVVCAYNGEIELDGNTWSFVNYSNRNVGSILNHLKDYKRGTVDWKDSLQMRPVQK